MKLKITDQFLWDIYNGLERAEDVVFFALNSYGKRFRFENPIFKGYRHLQNRRQFNWLVNYLKRHNYIKVKNLEGKQALMLTKKGIGKALMASFKAYKQLKRKDRKWIMIIFDIPQKHPKARTLLRAVLKNLNYKMFQQSVWVTPYDVADKTEKLLQYYNLDEYVKIFLIEKL